ncbi:phosphonate C-P lyase system protein PhnH [Enterobacillus tribolii]|uniref:Methylphosphonate degradation complex subunit PhnH n=1 Tax=Enterobacillus tribolii TaxID=1487935 RepID=A0A370R187_9GAMM|nr:phosphonate C-P lyase system protein PhnH [Enterobacillus tribolii]MBW7982746.1 phosphonate C-P lyase system protein PhnH [Enterobacillus tribolii]RDK95692.1 methylphosphonate degradation complex subunit PhnH [Enterobacillus tribolii]
MTLMTAFTLPVHNAQHHFRRLLKAMSEPGIIVTLPDTPAGWTPFSPATTGLLLTLSDQDTPLWLSPALNTELTRENLRFHCSSPLTDDSADAAIAVCDASLEVRQILSFTHGSDIAPETGATVIIQIDSLSGGRPLRLTGPGIADDRVIAPRLPNSVLDYLSDRPLRFPQGIDFIFTCGERLLALPRTTHVEVC